MTEKEMSLLREICTDAEACARLTQWEEEFLNDMRSRILTIGDRMHVTDAQWVIIRRIEEKVYR